MTGTRAAADRLVVAEVADGPDLAARVARLFYERQLTKVEIAGRLGVSRFRVARLLDEALANGLVRIEFRDAPPRDHDLGRRVAAMFGLRDCLVAAPSGGRPAADPEAPATALVARLAAELIDGLVGRGDAVGIAWGSTVAAVVRAMPVRDDPTIDVVQLAGSSTSLDAANDPGDLTRVLAERLGGRAHRIHAPAFVESAALRTALLRQPEIAATTQRFDDVAVAVLGVGAFGSGDEPPSSSLVRSGSLDGADIRRLAGLGAVGDLLVHPFTADGTFVAPELARRAIAISISQLRQVPHVVAIAAGPAKVEAIRGALRSGVVGSLVTDAATAQGLVG